MDQIVPQLRAVGFEHLLSLQVQASIQQAQLLCDLLQQLPAVVAIACASTQQEMHVRVYFAVLTSVAVTRCTKMSK
jgi:hypothetical protein